jgi:hypothetical protein
MAGGAVKAARIQSQGSSLNVFWAASTLPTTSILAAITRLNPSRRISKRPAGRHAAPARGRTPQRRHAAL